MVVYAALRIPMPKHEAEAIHKAMKPDDECPPKGFEIRSQVTGDSLMYEVRFKYGNPSMLLTLLSVLDEVSRIAEMIHDMIACLDR